jgi:hypothetical protein
MEDHMFQELKPIEVITASSISILANAAAECGTSIDQKLDIYREVIDKALAMRLLGVEDHYQLASSQIHYYFANKDK